MKKGGLIIDVLTGPPKGAADEAPEDEMLEDEEDAPAPASKSNPEALISGIESQLAQLRGLIAGL